MSDIELQDMIDKERELVVQERKNAVQMGNIDFSKTAPVKDTKDADSIADELIESAVGQAIVSKVQTDQTVQERLLNTAGKAIDHKLSEVESQTELADKKAYFNNHKCACEVFGYDEDTTNKKFVKAMAFIHNIFTAIWIFIGAFTFAPVIFVAKKISVIVKKTWIAVLIAIVIYLAIVLTPVLAAVLGKIK